MSVRTYNSSVRVGNWNEDIQLEEDTLKDFLQRKERGELLIQKTAGLRGAASTPSQLAVSRDGKVHFGDTVMLVNPPANDGSRRGTAMSLNIADVGSGSCSVTASNCTNATARTSFVITSCDGAPSGSSLQYGQKFFLCTPDCHMFLHSDRATFQKSAKMSRHNDVSFVDQASQLTQWKVVAFDPQFRLELEYTAVPANQKVIIHHDKTNQALCVEKNFVHRTAFGSEFELSTHTYCDSHKAEEDVNHWCITMNVPGDATMPVEVPRDNN